MKRLLQLVFVTIVLTSAAVAKPTITIGSEVFTLDREEHRANWTARHFLLAQESSPRWRRLVSVREFFDPHNDPKEFVAALAERYRKQDAEAKIDIYQSKATGDWMIDFVCLSSDPTDRFVEWNVWRAKPLKQGIVTYHYAARFYFKESSLEVREDVEKHRALMGPIVYTHSFEAKNALDNTAVAAAGAVPVAPPVPAKPAITIGREVFTLAHQEKDGEDVLREFLLAEESLQKWTRLVAVREYKTLDDPRQYVAAMARGYQKRNPGMKFEEFASTANNAWGIDFLIAPDDAEDRFVEWNVFRAQPAAQGIVVYQYAARLYFNESAAEVRDELVKLRAEMAPIVYAADFKEKVPGATSYATGSVSRTITIDGEIFTLAQEEQYTGVTVREFLPAQESYPNWNRMFVVREIFTTADPKQHIENLAKRHHAVNPDRKLEAFQDGATGDWVIDCVGGSDEPGNRYVQWNVWRTSQAKKGIVVYEYAERLHFKENPMDVKDALVKLRRDKAPLIYAARVQQKEEPEARPIAKPTITVDHEVFTLIKEERKPDGASQLFFPLQETSAKWSHVLAVAQYKLLKDADALIAIRVKHYQEGNPGKKFDMLRDEATGDWILDCVEVSRDPNRRTVDWIVFRAQTAKQGAVGYEYMTTLDFKESPEEVTEALAKLRAEKAPIIYATSFHEREAPEKVAAAAAGIEPVVDSVFGKPTITVGHDVFTLVREQTGENGALREFMLAHESADHWTRAITVNERKSIDDPKKLIATYAQYYQDQKLGTKFEVLQNPANGAWIMDCVYTPAAGDRFVDWNVWQARKAKQGIILHQYAARFYFKESAEEITEALAKLRAEMTPIVYAADFEEK